MALSDKSECVSRHVSCRSAAT